MDTITNRTLLVVLMLCLTACFCMVQFRGCHYEMSRSRLEAAKAGLKCVDEVQQRYVPYKPAR